MPYILISTQIRLETGPTIVGDEHSDPVIMNYLGARKTTMLGNNFSEYHVDEAPRVVLDKLENIGFRLVTMTGVGQTLVWCLHRDTVSQEGLNPPCWAPTPSV
ncbi:GTP cyclohydrolase 1 feedback regulatory protein isoform X2 [Brienomyrus brachyistius]|uniref:GTP cyclohydrolase 1 feedback regulatory protein isoform X2 n=1 Tax=Brienomyrus brachyistius TaxID=42636 RepID=UPI0020B45D39|nr:GTP cyclohydrolase 1 feedback regulatory protein isoform X2 [Brienomyrus brachyistius]